MKKLLLLASILLILVSPKISAQFVINPDFETWTPNSLVPNAKDPNSGNGTNGWWDFNMMNSGLFGSSPITVFQDSLNPSPEHNKYYAKIISAAMTSASYSTLRAYGFPFPDTNGLIITGNINVAFPNTSVKLGIPCTNDLKSFSFYYRYIPKGGSGNDTCGCIVVMFKYNSTTHKRDTLGYGYWSNSATVSTWTQATVTVNYTTNPPTVLPDTVLIAFSACTIKSAYIPKIGDTLDIDYSSVVLGINNVPTEHDNVTLFPNPASNELNLSVSGHFQAARMEVYDITGKAMGTYTIHNNFLSINTHNYINGLYFYKLLDDVGNQINVGRFSVVK